MHQLMLVRKLLQCLPQMAFPHNFEYKLRVFTSKYFHCLEQCDHALAFNERANI